MAGTPTRWGNTAYSSLEAASLAAAGLGVGLTGWTYDPVMATSTGISTISGRIYLAKFTAAIDGTISKIYMRLATAGATLTANQNFAGIYDVNGTLLGATATGAIDAALVGSLGLLTFSLTAPVTVQAGASYFVAIVQNGTTPAKFQSGMNNGDAAFINMLDNRFMQSTSTAQTSLPSVMPAVQTAAQSAWAAVS